MSVPTLEPKTRRFRNRANHEPVADPALDTSVPAQQSVDTDIDAQGPAADLVRVYLNGIGKTALLSAADEVELAKRIEAGVFAQHMLDTVENLSVERRRELRALVRDGHLAKNHLLEANLRLVVSLASATPAGACRCWT